MLSKVFALTAFVEIVVNNENNSRLLSKFSLKNCKNYKITHCVFYVVVNSSSLTTNKLQHKFTRNRFSYQVGLVPPLYSLPTLSNLPLQGKTICSLSFKERGRERWEIQLCTSFEDGFREVLENLFASGLITYTIKVKNLHP